MSNPTKKVQFALTKANTEEYDLDFQTKMVYKIVSLLPYRKMMIKDIESGLPEKKLARLKDLGLSVQETKEDKEEDDISLFYLKEWKTMSKEKKMQYCRYIAYRSVDPTSKLMMRKEELKDKLKSKIWFGGKKNGNN